MPTEPLSVALSDDQTDTTLPQKEAGARLEQNLKIPAFIAYAWLPENLS